MTLQPGDRLGPYQIIAPIAAGGMGEVYRARDDRLQRDVAVKVLPELFATDPERRARFEREAQAVAALSHPNILSIFDVGVQGRIAYAVTELLEGETLRERLIAGPVPLRKTVDYGVQIARGLAAAHDKGIVHRDLKPENLFLVADGRLKILDFGIARSVAAEGPTMAGSTDPGAVMGTAGYMAPEQVRGQIVDERADLFALGAVLYEMLSGRRAFQRDTVAETMTAILREDPPEVADARLSLPPGLERIVRHCLEKNPAERFQSARDVAFAIEALSGTATASVERVEAAAPASRRRIWPAAAVALVLIAAPAGFLAGRRATSAPPPVVTFEKKTFDAQFISNARFLPDGQTIVFSAALTGNIPSLFVSRANTAAPQPLGHERTHLLSVSASGELAVLTEVEHIGHRLYTGTLARMTLDGAPRSWMDHVREADWAPAGTDIAIVHDVDRIDHLEFPAGHVLYQSNGYISEPRVAPDGNRVAFVDHQARFDDRGWVKVVDRSGTVTALTDEFWGIEGLAWTPDGRAIAFAGATGGVAGYQPQLVAASPGQPVRQLLPSVGSVVVVDTAKDGRYLMLRFDDRMGIRVFTPGMKDERDLGWLNTAIDPRLSKDATLLLFTDQSEAAGPTYATEYRSVDGGPVARLGDGSNRGLSPDGRWAMALVLSQPQRLMLYPLGPGSAKQVDRGAITRYSSGSRWLPDGRILSCGSEGAQPPRCYQQTIDGKPQPMTPPGFAEASPAPDGRTLLLRSTDEAWNLARPDSSTIEPLTALSRLDDVVGWSRDSRAAYVQRRHVLPSKVERFDLISGARTTIREINAGDSVASMAIEVTEYRDDGSYVYWYWKRPTTMFVASGLPTRQ